MTVFLCQPVLVITIQFIWLWVKLEQIEMSNKDFWETSNIDVIAFDRDLHETLDSLPVQYSEGNVDEKFISQCALWNCQNTNWHRFYQMLYTKAYVMVSFLTIKKSLK